MGSKGSMFTILDHVRNGRLRPVVDRVMPLWSAADAHRVLDSRVTFGKIVLDVD
jgi:NADPH:quinone reductase-like Zn-dependent oxidoreductase